jgi:hypothetical protein
MATSFDGLSIAVILIGLNFTSEATGQHIKGHPQDAA